MQSATKRRVFTAAAPLFLGVSFLTKAIYGLVFAWWLDPLLQRKANRALLGDVQRNLYFLVSEANVVHAPTSVLPFDYASVEVLWENLFFVITRGRGEVNISVAPRHAPNELHRLGPAIAALEGRHLSQGDIVNDLGGAAALLRPRLQLLNAAFSEQEYAHTKARL